MNNIQLKVNDKKVPLNQFMKKIIYRTIFAIVGSLKGFDEDGIESIELFLSSKEDNA
ncbi:MAG: hypothetical protein KAS63_10825 [Candidatus Heimdallarchaeota archaeon]|nr:hypothetical protein [Candidatus Heimdallarchaeota archaeon]MCK4955849.1 hypothetical protein [Candidatus Heimdallarchaeota archaeon]